MMIPCRSATSTVPSSVASVTLTKRSRSASAVCGENGMYGRTVPQTVGPERSM
jgi:hypothetical protein